ncbi:MAG: chloramphenicol-sensitive protein RarD [Nocardioidaceae bacterium]|nr:chloramphenicol-sensitive protein RarD [Nocardioidaceae bacterium]
MGAAAFAMWGLFPLYWPLFEPAGAEEILAHRVLWSVVSLALLLAVSRRWAALRAIWLSPRLRALMSAAGVLIGINWFTYIWGVNNGHVVETALGYYINPLVSVLLGVAVLGERVRRVQWAALAIGLLAVLVLGLEVGRPPYIALILAFSFGSYGLIKKKAGVGPTEGITYESLVLAPVALGYLMWATAEGTAQLWSHSAWQLALLPTTGVVTALPLLLFAGSANRISLTSVGLLQYITPTLQFIIGVAVFHEPMPLARWLGFLLVWLALTILTVESLVVLRSRTTTGSADEPAASHA